MKNFIQNGYMITIIAPTGGVKSGAGVIVGNLFGIASLNAPEGSKVEIATKGVFDLPKPANATFTQGQRVSWDQANAQVVAPATGMFPIGIATLAAANGSTSAQIRLDGVSTAAT